MLTLLYLLAAGSAQAACDEAIFAVIPAPTPEGKDPGVATGMGTLDGKAVVGGRLSLDSAYPPDVWRKVLLDAESQDEWVPKKFGYQAVERFDPQYMYLRFDLGFLGDTVHVQRQLVVQTASEDAAGRFRTCWRMVDPAPHLPRIQGWVVPDVDWERTSTGWWEVTEQPDGTALVHYQWWAESGKIPAPIQRFGISRTLPDLMRAFEARVAEVAGKVKK